MSRANGLLIVAVCVVMVAGCAPASSPGAAATSAGSSQPNPPKRVVVAIMGDANTLYAKLNASAGNVPGLDSVQELTNGGLSVLNTQGALVAQLAEAVPSVENGLWKVFPDGGMETTWRIREGARWHDGTPFTTADLLFTATVMQDPELPSFGHPTTRLLEALDAPDSRTLTARWKQAFIIADALFSRDVGYPLPRHLLERTYTEERAQFLLLPHWNEQFIGTGPFKLRQFVRGSHLVLDANPDYVLGRPKIDVIEVRFIPDSATLGANILAGEIDLTIGRSLSQEQALQVRDQWREGGMFVAPYALTRIYSQFINPSPTVLLGVQFRRALVHALDRQTMVDTLESGLTEVAHGVLPPGRPEFRDVEAGIMRYDYDPRRATELVEALGYTRGSDGFFRDSAGARLGLEIRATAGQDILEKPVLLAADSWQRVGIAAEPLFIPVQRNQDRDYRHNRPGLQLAGGTSDLQILGYFHSSEIPLAETNYVGDNQSRYASAEYDGLYERYVVTVPQAERQQLLRRLVHHIAENLPIIALYYRVEPTMVAHRMQNVQARQRQATQAWNAHEWDAN